MTEPIPHELRALRLFFLTVFGVGAVLPAFGRLPLGLAFLCLGAAGTVVLHRMQKCEESEAVEFVPKSFVASLVKACAIVVVFLFAFFHLAIPNLNGIPRSTVNECAAIATLKNIASAQAQCQAIGAIDRDGDGEGEYGYFGELSGGIALRGGTNRLTPPVLSGAFANLHAHDSIDGGVVIRSGYHFQLFLPDASDRGLPEADAGGTGATPPHVDHAEKTWCCYAWPTSHGDSGKRAFFVNQEGDVLSTKNLVQRYSGAAKPPSWDAAFAKRARTRLASSVAANSTGRDGQVWIVVN